MRRAGLERSRSHQHWPTALMLVCTFATGVVVTSTLTGLAADSRLAGGTGAGWRRRAGAVVVLVAGAVVGALLRHVHLAAGFGLAGAVLVGVTAAGRASVRAEA